MAEPSDRPEVTEDEKIIKEAKDRWKYCEDFEAKFRILFVDDLKFANADSDNNYQWPDSVANDMEDQDRVMLTINRVRQHNLQIINDARQNKPSISIKPTGNGATYESAQVFEGVVRHIEYISNAQVAYDTATRFQVQCGYGAWRVITDYAGDDSFDQEIFIRRIKDPLSVYIDSDIVEADGSDAKFAFIFDDMSRDEFDKKYPDYKDKVTQTALGNGDGWIDKDKVRVAEYYRKVDVKDTLLHITGQNGEQKVILASELPKELLALALADGATKTRDVVGSRIEWFLIVADEIAERKKVPGRYIPVVRVTGEETMIDGVMDRKGHTRAMKDPQRMYNYWSSAAVQQVALQNVTPYITPVAAIEGLETYWANANRSASAYLPYNHISEAGGETIPAPARQEPPQMAVAFINGMKIASEEIQAVSGQFEAEMGMQGNERSGVAIQQRQRQGDNATYHYIDHLGLAIRYTGKILVNWIPEIYDTPRVIRIMAEDGTEKDVQLDPAAQQAYQEQQKQEAETVSSIFNPNVGKYDVQSDIGPSYGTRRQEAFEAIERVLSQSKELTPVIGDLLFKSADFPMADEIAERLKRMVPPQALGDGANPQVQHIQQVAQEHLAAADQEISGLKDGMAKIVEENARLKLELKNKGDQTQVDWFKAITDRLDVIQQHTVTPRLTLEMTHDLAVQEHAQNHSLLSAGVAQDLQPEPVAPEPAQPEMAE